jgi:hypothetical protein
MDVIKPREHSNTVQAYKNENSEMLEVTENAEIKPNLNFSQAIDTRCLSERAPVQVRPIKSEMVNYSKNIE